MTPEEYKILSEKIAKGDASLKETLLFLKELNLVVINLNNDLTSIKNYKQ